MDEILRSVKKYINDQPEKPFVAGESRVPISGATWNADDMAQAVEVLLSRWYGGKTSYEFERLLANIIKQRHVALCNSGSSANLLAISALTSRELGERRLQKGDEVITVACGFPTTVNPIIQNGLIPVFVDINLPGYNALPHAIEEAISDKTKAVFIAHTLGNPFKARELRDLCDRSGLWMIADCCDALGSENRGEPVSHWADISTFSFYPAHHISTMEGGAVATNNPRLDKIIRSFRDWGRSCFPKGTLVNVAGEQIPIEDVKVGDFVLSHLGENRRVYETLTRKYTGDFYTIKPKNGKEISCTSNHPFWVIRNNNYEWVKAEDLNKSDILLESLPSRLSQEKNIEMSYSYSTEYKEVSKTVEVTPELMRLVGYWLAEGSLSSGLKGKSGYSENKYKFYRVDFAFHEDEIEYIEDVVRLMNKVFGVSTQIKKSNGRGVSLQCKSRMGFEFFFQFFGRGAKNKRIPDILTKASNELCINLILGYWNGDGGGSRIGYNFSSTSPHLLNQIRRILARLGIMSSYSEVPPEKKHPSVVGGKQIKAKHTQYCINIYGKSAKKFSEIFELDIYKLSGKKSSHSYVDGEYICYPIDSIKIKKVKNLPVYNLEVESDHSYHANNLAVHNCWCLPGKDNTCGKRYEWDFEGVPQGFDHKYIYSEVGYNLKSSDIHAALGINQLKRLGTYIQARENNWSYYRKELDDLSEFFVLPEPTAYSKPSWFGFMLTVKDKAPFMRKDFIKFLDESKIDSRMLFGGNLVRQPAYKEVEHRVAMPLVKTDRVMENGLWIGVFQGITRPMQEYVVERIHEFVEKSCETTQE